MSQSQKWPLSQNAHKSSGGCSVCHAVRQLHNSNGTVHRHGPRNNPCPPAAVRPYVLPTTLQQSAASSATTSQQIDVSASISSIPGTDPAPADGFPQPQLVRRCMKHIPKSARPACAQRYVELLRRCTGNPHNLQAWEELLNFGRDVLAQPTKGGKRHNLASVIKKRTIEPHTADHEIVSHKTKSTDAATLLANAVSAKIEDGNIRGAIRIMCSEDTPARNTDSVHAQLVDKHPAPPLDRGSVPDPQPTVAVEMTEEEVIHTVCSFPPGSEGGPDGVRPQHILEMISCRESGPELRSALTGFVNCLLQGHIHPQVSPVLFWWQLDCTAKEIQRNTSYCGRLYSASHCRQMCQQLCH